MQRQRNLRRLKIFSSTVLNSLLPPWSPSKSNTRTLRPSSVHSYAHHPTLIPHHSIKYPSSPPPHTQPFPFPLPALLTYKSPRIFLLDTNSKESQARRKTGGRLCIALGALADILWPWVDLGRTPSKSSLPWLHGQKSLPGGLPGLCPSAQRSLVRPGSKVSQAKCC